MNTLFQEKRSNKIIKHNFQLAHNKFPFVFYFKLNHHTLLFCILCLKINTKEIKIIIFNNYKWLTFHKLTRIDIFADLTETNKKLWNRKTTLKQ